MNDDEIQFKSIQIPLDSIEEDEEVFSLPKYTPS